MMICAGDREHEGTPTVDGTYAVEAYHGWKLLEWHNGEWWHTGLVGRCFACDAAQWVGPLPPLMGQKKEYDL